LHLRCVRRRPATARTVALTPQGVGIANCGKLANDLKPSQGDAKKVKVSEKDAFNPWEQ
jgi:hypothetical protein